jgi:RNA polymerase sigma factor (TIGR02999 family)
LPQTGLITGLLRRRDQGDRDAEEELFRHVYKKLHNIASRRIRAERRDHTIQPTALIHETYLALMQGASIEFADRMHFYAVASQAMRRILIDYARQKAAAKRSGGQQRVDLQEAHVFSLEDPDFILALDQSLDRLRQQSERACRIVELRVFGGLSLDDIACTLGVSLRTVKRDWQVARIRLYQELYGSAAGS